MKKIVVLISALVLAASASAAAFSVAANTSGAAGTAKPIGIIALNHARTLVANNTMQKAIDSAVARAAAAKAAQDAAASQAAAAQQTANQGGSSNNSSGGSDQMSAASTGGEDLWGVLASFGVPDTSIAYGDTHGYEAISYYKTGYIVINPNHTYDLYTLVAHEINHIIAWRESGKTTEN